MRQTASPINYRLGTLYSLVTACLLATQEPFSSLAATLLSAIQFVFLTQVALFVSIPLLTFRPVSRSDLIALLRDRSNYAKLAVLFAVGVTGLLLYNLGLAHSHPIIISAILNLSPFWSALVALLISRVPIPVSPAIFFGCFAGAFGGAMAVAWSQLSEASRPSTAQLLSNLLQGSWVYAMPVPICSALGGTLVAKWFAKYDESAAIAANFLFANVILIPTTLVILYQRSELNLDHPLAILLMIVGTIVASAVGRVLWQIAITVTGGDNGFVTMFFNLVPALTALISLVMSRWIASLHFNKDPTFFLGLAAIVVSLFLFSLRQPARRAGTDPGSS